MLLLSAELCITIIFEWKMWGKNSITKLYLQIEMSINPITRRNGSPNKDGSSIKIKCDILQLNPTVFILFYLFKLSLKHVALITAGSVGFFFFLIWVKPLIQIKNLHPSCPNLPQDYIGSRANPKVIWPFLTTQVLCAHKNTNLCKEGWPGGKKEQLGIIIKLRKLHCHGPLWTCCRRRSRAGWRSRGCLCSSRCGWGRGRASGRRNLQRSPQSPQPRAGYQDWICKHTHRT